MQSIADSGGGALAAAAVPLSTRSASSLPAHLRRVLGARYGHRALANQPVERDLGGRLAAVGLPQLGQEVHNRLDAGKVVIAKPAGALEAQGSARGARVWVRGRRGRTRGRQAGQ